MSKTIQTMSVEILTKADLQQFKIDFLNEFTELLKNSNTTAPKKWLKSYQVRELLGGISRGTLQTMTDNGTLPASLVGGLMFYDYDDLLKLMQKNKQGRK